LPAAFRGGRSLAAFSYGGVTFGYSRNQYRVFAPNSGVERNTRGTIVNIGGGWGNEAFAHRSNVSLVRVRAGLDSTPDFDSGWFEVTANGPGPSHFVFNHSLGVLPARVRVIAKAMTGQDVGFVFDGCGAPQADDDEADASGEDALGGIVYGYSDVSVRLWTASSLGQPFRINAHLITAGMRGWGVNSAATTSPYLSGQVRVMAWRDGPVPSFESAWLPITACSSQAFLEIPHNLGKACDALAP
jgi:hypothetical protein